MIQAEALAARATADLIEDISLTTKKRRPGARGAHGAIPFCKADANDELAQVEAALPLLSLVPGPSLPIETERLKLAAKIVYVSIKSRAPFDGRAIEASHSIARRLPAADKVSVVSKLLASSTSKTREIQSYFDLEREIIMKQADRPLGLEKLLPIMDSAIPGKKS